MSLLTELSEEFIEELAYQIHDEICSTMYEEYGDELDEDDEEECVGADIQTVRRLLERLEAEGVSYSPLIFTDKEI